MGRENCQMCHFLGDTMYCDFYDVFYAKCEGINICPDGLDEDEDEYDDDDIYDEYDETDS
jgi:hypothetical protein